MKKMWALLCAVCMLLSLSACAAGQTPVGNATATTTQPSTTVTAATTTTTGIASTTEGTVTTTENTTTEEGTTAVTRPTRTPAGKEEGTVVVVPTTATTVRPVIPTLPPTTVAPTTRVTTVAATTRPTTAVTTGGTGGTPTTATTATTQAPTTTTQTTTTLYTRPTYAYTTGQTHTPLPYTARYCYLQLDETQRGWYRLIAEAVDNLEEATPAFYVDPSYGDDWYNVYRAYQADHPEKFYLSSHMTIYSLSDNMWKIGFCYSVRSEANEPDSYYRHSFGEGAMSDTLRQKIRAKEAVFQTELNRILATIPANIPAVDKEWLAYKRLLIDGHYNLGAQWDGLCEDNWTAYGLLVNKYGVCESYSEAFQVLCQQMGIRCTTISGSAGGGHMWNAVQLDGEWYMCDVTFDDPLGGGAGVARHNYFNRTDDEFRAWSHEWPASRYVVYPQCNGTKYSFENYFGDYPYSE